MGLNDYILAKDTVTFEHLKGLRDELGKVIDYTWLELNALHTEEGVKLKVYFMVDGKEYGFEEIIPISKVIGLEKDWEGAAKAIAATVDQFKERIRRANRVQWNAE